MQNSVLQGANRFSELQMGCQTGAQEGNHETHSGCSSGYRAACLAEKNLAFRPNSGWDDKSPGYFRLQSGGLAAKNGRIAQPHAETHARLFALSVCVLPPRFVKD